MRLKCIPLGILLLIQAGIGCHLAQSLTTNNNYTVCASGAYNCPSSEGVKNLHIKKQKELLKISFWVQVILYHMVRYLSQLHVVQWITRFCGGQGRKKEIVFILKFILQIVSVNCCHCNGCETACSVSLIGRSHQKHCPFSSPSSHLCCTDGKCSRPSNLG